MKPQTNLFTTILFQTRSKRASQTSTILLSSVLLIGLLSIVYLTVFNPTGQAIFGYDTQDCTPFGALPGMTCDSHHAIGLETATYTTAPYCDHGILRQHSLLYTSDSAQGIGRTSPELHTQVLFFTDETATRDYLNELTAICEETIGCSSTTRGISGIESPTTSFTNLNNMQGKAMHWYFVRDTSTIHAIGIEEGATITPAFVNQVKSNMQRAKEQPRPAGAESIVCNTRNF